MRVKKTIRRLYFALCCCVIHDKWHMPQRHSSRDNMPLVWTLGSESRSWSRSTGLVSVSFTLLYVLPPCCRQPSERQRADPVFYDTKIERAGGREVVSRSRSTRHKRNSTRESLHHRANRSQDHKHSTEPPLITSYESRQSTGGRSSHFNSR